MAVLNDSTGTLMSCAHRKLNCRIGVIIGKNKNEEKVKLNFFWTTSFVSARKVSIRGCQSMIFNIFMSKHCDSLTAGFNGLAVD